MSSNFSSVDDSGAPRKKNPALLMFRTAADTSWRMFIPIIGATIVGMIIDKKLGTTPWLMIILMALGIWLATVLVLKQLNYVKKAKKL